MRAFQVTGPAMPVSPTPAWRWNARRAACVAGPYTPSTGTPAPRFSLSWRWRALTASPVEPGLDPHQQGGPGVLADLAVDGQATVRLEGPDGRLGRLPVDAVDLGGHRAVDAQEALDGLHVDARGRPGSGAGSRPGWSPRRRRPGPGSWPAAAGRSRPPRAAGPSTPVSRAAQRVRPRTVARRRPDPRSGRATWIPTPRRGRRPQDRAARPVDPARSPVGHPGVQEPAAERVTGPDRVDDRHVRHGSTVGRRPTATVTGPPTVGPQHGRRPGPGDPGQRGVRRQRRDARRPGPRRWP